MPMRLISWNIYVGRLTNSSELSDFLKRYESDVICLQEVDKCTNRSKKIDLTKEIAEKLGYESYYFEKTLDFDGGEFGLSIISKKEVSNISTYKFKSTLTEKRLVMSVVVGDTIILNTHLELDSTINKAQILELIKVTKELQKNYKKIILCGDFNNSLKNAEMQELLTFYNDSYINTATNVDDKINRIDYVFLDNSFCKEHRKINTNFSDHAALYVESEVQND